MTIPTPTSSTAPKAANTAGPQATPKQGTTKIRSPATMAARRQASARYRDKNLEEERGKARVRMARHRERVKQQQDLAEESGRGLALPAARFVKTRSSSKDSSYGVHMKLSSDPATTKRLPRAYGQKHGPRAWLERRTLMEERRAQAEDLAEDRRREAELAGYRRNEAESRRMLGAQS
ncbi:hypothetical protein B0H13DRAFT_1919387 [Mycena leptocephala]|nr:hypothetical protein B0H13DRAFT_1919387 [Mycena leptocephala]